MNANIMMIVKENIGDLLKPQNQEELDTSFDVVINKLKSFNIREDAIAYLTNLLHEITDSSTLPIDVRQEIINYMSENEFNEALVFILKEFTNHD